MDVPQEKKAEETQPETATTVEEAKAPIILETSSMVERVENSDKSIKEQVDRFEKLVERSEAMNARMMLGGKTEAGTVTKSPEQEIKEKAEAEAKEILDRLKPPRVKAI